MNSDINNGLAYKVLFLLRDYFTELKDSHLVPNTVLLGDKYLLALKETFPEMVQCNKLIYNERSLEICITKNDNTVGLAYSYHNDWV